MERMLVYDDQIRIYLMETLKNVPYLGQYCDDPAGKETLSHIVYSMKVDVLESGAAYFKTGEK